MSKRRKRNSRARHRNGGAPNHPTTIYDDLPAGESIPTEGVLASCAAAGAHDFVEACVEIAAEHDTVPTRAAAQTAVWLAPIAAKVAWDAALDRHPEHPAVRAAQQTERASVPLDGGIKAMQATGRINDYSGQQLEPGDLPVLYIAVRGGLLSAVESAVTNASDCFHEVAYPLLKPWQPEQGHETFVKLVGGESEAMLKAFGQSVHTQTRHALFTAVEQIIRADFNFYGEGDPSEDPRLETLREAVDRSDRDVEDLGPVIFFGVKAE